MSYIIVDVESDNQSPVNGSIVCFGAVVLDVKLDKTFYGKTKPITEEYNEEALSISGFSRNDHLTFDEPGEVMKKFETWVKENSMGRAVFVSDNPAFDWQWINFYFHKYIGSNPFGHSARRIGDLYCGLVRDVRKNRDWKRKYRKTKHTHNPVDDALGNAEALLAMKKEFSINIPV